MPDLAYSRTKAVEYATEWALLRNPRYMNFEKLGGDCTNFASQCLLAGCGVMNFQSHLGWYYIDATRRSPSWSGVHFLHEFLVNNAAAGPFGKVVPLEAILPGDLIQYFSDGRFRHTLVVVRRSDEEIIVCAHTVDALYRNLATYEYDRLRPIHILGARS